MAEKPKLLAVVWMILVITLAAACQQGEQPKQQTLTMDTSETEVDDPLENKGIGPVKNVELAALDAKLASEGEKIFSSKCLACHKFDQRVVGPALKDVTKRRSPEWLMNLMVNTNEMVEKDPIVKGMIAEYMTKMTFQDVSEKDARAVLEYLRQKDGVQ